MPKFICPECGGGFEEPYTKWGEHKCPWCGHESEQYLE